ncbi:acyltransferase family protein [Acidobacterium sp. S8]|uniref:acyltransferase family protein n=1 Tax=Acidobacterium sp. S8 TaxID=1641854 RepID=UPI00131C74F2|nr:heparan-alpha-glucosaminide N-acetyltransferase domain-containing protein [Acidobacterium sp. S8]
MTAIAAARTVSLKESSASAPAFNRLFSLDVFRGMAVAGMILVTDPGTYSAVYWPLLHAQWNGATPTDMIFPGFLFAVGIAITLSFAGRIERGANRAMLATHVLRRSAIIFLLGLIVNGFPDYNLHTIRIPGVLQRIALCYLAGALLYLALSGGRSNSIKRTGIVGGVAAALLAGYWALLKLVPVRGFGAGRLDSLGNLPAYVDRAVFGTNHMWAYGTTPGYGVTFDPEGLLSTLPAIATLLIGVIAGEWLRSKNPAGRKALLMAAAGCVLLVASLALNPLFPINKKIWTSTFALLSGGVSLLAFSLLYYVLDIKRWREWSTPFLTFGTNAILAFALSNVMTTLTDRIHINAGGSAITLHQWGYQYGFATGLAPVHASLAYAIFIVLINLALIYPLYRKRIFLRV